MINPSRTIPRALGVALSLVTALYMAIQLVAQGILGTELAQSSAPLSDAMARLHPGLGALMLAGAAVSMLGWLSSDLLSSPRILFAFGRDRLMPRALGRVHPRTHAPHVAIACYATIAIVLALTGTFVQLAVLSMLAIAPLYVAACAAAWRLSRTEVALAGAPLGFRWIGGAAAVGTTAMIVLVGLASAKEMLGLVAVVALCVIAYVVQPWSRRPATAAVESESV